MNMNRNSETVNDLYKIRQDFEKSINTRRKIEASMDFDDYISFLNEMQKFTGHPKSQTKPITGDRFLL